MHEIIKTESNDLVTFDIDDAKIDEIAGIADNIAMWVKPVAGGFMAKNNDKVVPEITGVITKIHPYLVKWENGKADKISNVMRDEEIPAEYRRGCDLKVFDGNQVIAMSLATSSFVYQLAPYIKFLKNNGLRPQDVITKLRSKQKQGIEKTYSIVIFEMINKASNNLIHTEVVSTQHIPPAQSSQSALIQDNPWG